MALLEINGEMRIDARFDLLGQITGKGKYDAIGRILPIWFDCIEKTKDIRTEDEIEFLSGWFHDGGSFAEMLVKSKLAEQVPGGYRIKGVRKRMQWLVELREKRKMAGSKGGAKRAGSAIRDNTGRFSSKNDQKESKQSQASAKQNHTNPGGSVPVPGSVSGSSPDVVKKSKILPDGKTLGSKIFESYAEAYKKKYGAYPTRDSQANSLCKQIGESLGEEGIEVARYYLSHTKYGYMQAMHPLTFLRQDCSALRTQWSTGNAMTHAKAKSGERAQQSFGAFEKHFSPKIGGSDEK